MHVWHVARPIKADCVGQWPLRELMAMQRVYSIIIDISGIRLSAKFVYLLRRLTIVYTITTFLLNREIRNLFYSGFCSF